MNKKLSYLNNAVRDYELAFLTDPASDLNFFNTLLGKK